MLAQMRPWTSWLNRQSPYAAKSKGRAGGGGTRVAAAALEGVGPVGGRGRAGEGGSDGGAQAEAARKTTAKARRICRTSPPERGDAGGDQLLLFTLEEIA